jgi:hypothetical protein
MPTFLHVGCGRFTKANTTPTLAGAEWREIRYDIDPSVQPDLIGTMTDMSLIGSGQMDALYSAHNIEHLYPHDVPIALKEFRRVLADDGFVIIVCPDLQSVCALVADDNLDDPAYLSGMGPIAPIDILYGHRAALAAGNSYMAHRCGFTQKTMKAALSDAGFAGFAGFRRAIGLELWALATVRECRGDELERLATQHFPLG